LLVFGHLSGEYAAKFARENGKASINEEQIQTASRSALAPFEGEGSSGGNGPYQVQQELQEAMQSLVGIVRTESDLKEGLEIIEKLKSKATTIRVEGNREYNPGWHTALDLHNLLTISEAIARCAVMRKESRGAHFRLDYPEKTDEFAGVNMVIKKDSDGRMQVESEPIAPLTDEHKQIIEDNK